MRTGNAHETLPGLAAEKPDRFDLVFIDADKQSSPDYFTWALARSRPGSLIITDNVVRVGAVIDADSDDPSALGSRRLHALLGAEQRGSATTIQTVGPRATAASPSHSCSAEENHRPYPPPARRGSRRARRWAGCGPAQS